MLTFTRVSTRRNDSWYIYSINLAIWDFGMLQLTRLNSFKQAGNGLFSTFAIAVTAFSLTSLFFTTIDVTFSSLSKELNRCSNEASDKPQLSNRNLETKVGYNLKVLASASMCPSDNLYECNVSYLLTT